MNYTKILLILNLILFAGFISPLNATTVQEDTITEDTITYVYIKIEVKGLSCPFCAYGLEKKLKEIEGATDVEIDIKQGLATFKIDKNQQPKKDQLRKAVKDAGFTPEEITISTAPFTTDTDDK